MQDSSNRSEQALEQEDMGGGLGGLGTRAIEIRVKHKIISYRFFRIGFRTGWGDRVLATFSGNVSEPVSSCCPNCFRVAGNILANLITLV